MENEADGNRILVEDLPRHTPETCRPGGMRARRADHYRAHHIEDRDFTVVSYGHDGDFTQRENVRCTLPAPGRKLPRTSCLKSRSSSSSMTTHRSSCSCEACCPNSASTPHPRPPVNNPSPSPPPNTPP